MSGKITAADGNERQLKGYKRSTPKAGTQTYNKKSARIAKLPNKVDLRPFMTEVENQGDTNSCTANATAGAYEYLIKKHEGEITDVSRLFVYYNARYMSESDDISDEGAMISDVIERSQRIRRLYRADVGIRRGQRQRRAGRGFLQRGRAFSGGKREAGAGRFGRVENRAGRRSTDYFRYFAVWLV